MKSIQELSSNHPAKNMAQKMNTFQIYIGGLLLNNRLSIIIHGKNKTDAISDTV